MKNISKAIINVMKEVQGMEKNSRVGSGQAAYDGTKDSDVKEAFNKALSDNGLCILPIDIKEETQVDRWEEETKFGIKQKQSIFTKVLTKYLLLHESGESIELSGYGHGTDSQDKGSGKATTYALKNCLLYTFLTPVGKIDDTDTTHSNDIATPKTEDNRKWFNQGSKDWKNAVEKKVPLLEVMKHYKVSKENQQVYTDELKALAKK